MKRLIFLTLLLSSNSHAQIFTASKGDSSGQSSISKGNSQGKLTFMAPPLGWPTGADGSFVCNSTIHWAAGSIFNYSSVDIQAGCLIIVDEGTAWTILGVSGNMTMATATQVQIFFNPSNGGTYNTTAPDGMNLSYSVSQAGGGDGGTSGGCGAGGGGGAGGASGGGGGGQGSGAGSTDNISGSGSNASEGGLGGDPVDTAVSGYSAAGLGGGDDTTNAPGGGCTYGAGGSGATKGYHGGLFYLKVGGTLTVPTFDPMIIADGSGGGDGGAGGTGGLDISGSSGGGGGGGGGAGGDGGAIVIRYHAGSFTTDNSSVNYGSGGFGGTGGGFSAGPGGGSNGEDGGVGRDGVTGSLDIATY